MRIQIGNRIRAARRERRGLHSHECGLDVGLESNLVGGIGSDHSDAAGCGIDRQRHQDISETRLIRHGLIVGGINDGHISIRKIPPGHAGIRASVLGEVSIDKGRPVAIVVVEPLDDAIDDGSLDDHAHRGRCRECAVNRGHEAGAAVGRRIDAAVGARTVANDIQLDRRVAGAPSNHLGGLVPRFEDRKVNVATIGADGQ